MAIVPRELFGWQEVNAESDLKRLELALKNLLDEGLMKELEKERGRGRDDYPVRAIWNSIVAGIVYEHISIESLRRELQRNGELRQICGFDVIKGARGIPSSSAYTRFLKKLKRYQGKIDEMFDNKVDELIKLLPDYGRELAADSKAISSHGKPNKSNKADGRRETEADWGVKKYKGKTEDGQEWEKTKKWFGYKVHTVVDSKHDLPIGYEVTKASVSDNPELLKMIPKVEDKHKQIIERAKRLRADRGYDSEENNKELWDRYGIKPIIDIRKMWKDGEESRPLYGGRADNIVYDQKGVVYCHCPADNTQREMAYMGYEKKRNSLKYRCPAQSYGFKCKGSRECGETNSAYGRIVRIALETDRRLFTPIARSSYAWKRAYKGRTSVERVNSRLDVTFGFERHFIRGMSKMKLRVSLAVLVMNAMAVGHIREKRQEQMRSLVSQWKIAA